VVIQILLFFPDLALFFFLFPFLTKLWYLVRRMWWESRR